MGSIALLSTLSAQNNGKLIIFLQHGRSITEDFKRNVLPEMEEYAKQQDIQLEVLDARNGAPAEIKLTPAVVFQDHRSRSVFRGRYRKFSQLTKFVENARQIPKTETVDIQEFTPTWNIGRATLTTSFKLMPLTGKVPSDFNQEQFDQAAFQSLVAGMEYFKLQEKVDVAKQSKSFLMEFYPEKTSDGVLLVSMKLYAEFDTVNPVFVTTIPSGGEWKEPDFVFKKAGNRIEKALIAQISNWDNGDGFDTLSDKTPVKSWQELGLGTVSSSSASK
jgi:hypothetical protein